MPDPNVQWTGSLQWHQFANASTVDTIRTLTIPPTTVVGRVVTLFVLLSTTSFALGGVIGTTVHDANGLSLPFAFSDQGNSGGDSRLVAVPDWPASVGGHVDMEILTTDGAAAGVMLGALLASNNVFAVDYGPGLGTAGTSATESQAVPLLGFPYLIAAGASSLNTANPPGGPALTDPIGLDPDWPVAISANFNEPRSIFGVYYVAGALSTYIGTARNTTVTPTWNAGVVTPWATNSLGVVVRPGQRLGSAYGTVLG